MAFSHPLKIQELDQKESIADLMHKIKEFGIKSKKIKNIEFQVQNHSEFISKHEEKIKHMVTK